MRPALLALLAAAVLASPAAAVPRTDWGSTFRVAPDAAITLRASAAVSRSDAWLAGWASFVGGLPHGAELDGLAVPFVTPAELGAFCGSGYACFFPQQGRLVVPSEPVGGWPVEHLLAHEYGHYIAAHRRNPPWGALLAGTRRWATAMHVCERLHDGSATLHTGLRDDAGEAFAESYRLLAAQGAGWPAAPGWEQDESFLPDGNALAAIREDIEHPWTPAVVRSFTVRVRRPQEKIELAFDPALDGSIGARLVRGPRGASVRLVGSPACGRRPLKLELTAPRRGAYTVDVVG